MPLYDACLYTKMGIWYKCYGVVGHTLVKVWCSGLPVLVYCGNKLYFVGSIYL